jgi:hypothetical protein
VYGKQCHLPVSVEHKAFWAIKECNVNMEDAARERKYQLNELDEIRLEAYENSKFYKERTKQMHDKLIRRKDIVTGQKVLLFNSRLKIMPGKLKSRWTGPYTVNNVLPNGVFEISNSKTTQPFKVNGYRLKPYYENIGNIKTVESISLAHPVYT